MKIAIDATNLREGGGVTHLTQLLNGNFLNDVTIQEILILGCKETLSQIDDNPKIIKINKRIFEKNYLIRVLWLSFMFDSFLKKRKIDLLFSPGGFLFTSFHPCVTMSRNSLPLELEEARRYRFSFVYLRLLFLRYFQKKSFLKSDGFIFLSNYAMESFIKQGWFKLKKNVHKISIIPHGVSSFFCGQKSKISSFSQFSEKSPFKILYVSIIDLYKHQDKVLLAVEKLNLENYFVEINFVGPYYKPAFKTFKNIIDEISDKIKPMINYHGKLDIYHQQILYKQMDCFLFASSCENMPNILLEGMSSGLPIICSNRGPMPEILKHAGVYFNPESIESICDAIKKLYNSVELRSNLSEQSLILSKSYSWEKCANETFEFLAQFKK
jgi:glycosyltransferase involved in cell wall biosynthesis